jgi:hypothetical protein
MPQPIFVWERDEEEIQAIPDKRYLFYYRGCFCPPHIGHFSLVEDALKYPNSRVIIHQMGNSRHGVPRVVNREIWQTYIDELLPTKRVDLVEYNKGDHGMLTRHEWAHQADVIVIIKSDEHLSHRRERIGSSYQEIASFCHRRQVPLIFHITNRSKRDTLSATSLIRNVIEYRKGKLRLDDLRSFFPHGLHLNTIRSIVKTIMAFDLK